MADREEPCVFCSLAEPYIAANELAFAFEDIFPAAPGHCLVVPRRHILTLDEATAPEALSLVNLLPEVKRWIRAHYGADGFNIGLNEGAAAGQTVPHLHLHVIPRRRGDVPDPRGGIRKVLPGRQRYPFRPGR